MRARIIVCFTVVFLVSVASSATFKLDKGEASRKELKMHPYKRQLKARSLNPIKSNELWLAEGKQFVSDQLSKKVNKNVAKNVIFFIGDGMSLPTIAATRLLLGGEEKALSFEKFPFIGAVKTYCLDRQTPDSASTATAYLTGIKGNYGTIGVNGYVQRDDCVATTDESNYSYSIAKWSMEAGKSAGLVTTTRVTHASPAGVYAHTAERDWECDADVNKDCGTDHKIQDIALQLIHGSVGKHLSVILGGGRKNFIPKTQKDEEGKKGERVDGRNLIQEWSNLNNDSRTYVWNREQLLNVDPSKTDRLLGLFESSHMLYHLEAEEEGKDKEKPTLAEMTKKAIEILNKNENGFFLFVEGGKIDIAHHDVYAKIALDETSELSKAVATARSLTSEEDTLIVVSSDHAHTMSYVGYPPRKNDIFSVAGHSDVDKMPFFTLSYANGKGFDLHFNSANNTRVDPRTIDQNSSKFTFPSTVPLDTETHGGEDVAVFASGPWSHLFTGVYEQNALPHLMGFASCVGEGQKAC